jgi:hypothetical protein
MGPWPPAVILCNGVLLKPRNIWVFVFMSGYSIYLDDSGHPVDKPYLALGGFIAREDRWLDFEIGWKQALRTRKIAFPFHSTDFFSAHKNDPKLKHIVTDLVVAITNHVEAAFSVVIDIGAYNEFNESCRLDEFAGTPFAIVTRCLYENVEEWQKIVGARAPLLFFVESGTLHRGDMMDCLKDRDGITPPIPVPKDHVACQAADLYAYSVYQTALHSGKPFLSLGCFQEKLSFPRERRDTRISRSDLEAYLSRPTSVVPEVAGNSKVRIPPRSGTEDMSFKFKGNQKKTRRSIIEQRPKGKA